MSEDLDFIEEETGSNRRSFIVIAGAMGVVAVLMILCLAALIIQRSGNDGDADGAIAAVTATVAAIETANAGIATQNAFVTETLVARATEDARPTNTPTSTALPPTPTATATLAPTATNTPVVSSGEDDGDGDGEGDGSDAGPTATVSLLSTPFGGSSAGGATATPIGGTSGTSTLPQTGINLWGGFLAAIVLLSVLVVARRLRTTGG